MRRSTSGYKLICLRPKLATDWAIGEAWELQSLEVEGGHLLKAYLLRNEKTFIGMTQEGGIKVKNVLKETSRIDIPLQFFKLTTSHDGYLDKIFECFPGFRLKRISKRMAEKKILSLVWTSDKFWYLSAPRSTRRIMPMTLSEIAKQTDPVWSQLWDRAHQDQD